MTRVHPSHVLALAALAGLASANAVRPAATPLFVALAVLVVALAPPPVWRAAAVVLLLAWWWGGVRLDALDRTVLGARVGTAGRFTLVTTAPARTGTFARRQFAEVRALDGRPLAERVELQLGLGRPPPAQGAVVSALAEVAAPRGPSHGFDERLWLRRQGIHVVLHVHAWTVVGRRGGIAGVCDRLRAWLARASGRGLGGERRALVEGVLLGDDTGLSDRLKQAFRRSGLYHLLAVSGQNVVLLATGVLALAVLAGVGRVWGHVAALAAIGAYVAAVGPQPSVVRAAVAGGAVSVAWLLGRQKDAWQVLLLAAVALLAWSPYALFDAGFQLSFVAVLAIFLVSRPLLVLLEGYPLPERARPVVALSVACGVATAPLLWLQFGQVPLLGVVANVLVEPAVPPLLGLAFAAALVDPVSPALAAILAWANGWVAAYVAVCARAVAAIPAAQATGRGAALAAAAALAACALLVRLVRPDRTARR